MPFSVSTNGSCSYHVAASPTLKELVCLGISRWYEVGLRLDIDEAELDIIKQNFPSDAKSCRLAMFRTWLQVAKQPTYQRLVNELWTIEECRAAKELAEKFGKQALHCVVSRAHRATKGGERACNFL